MVLLTPFLDRVASFKKVSYTFLTGFCFQKKSFLFLLFIYLFIFYHYNFLKPPWQRKLLREYHIFIARTFHVNVVESFIKNVLREMYANIRYVLNCLYPFHISIAVVSRNKLGWICLFMLYGLCVPSYF